MSGWVLGVDGGGTRTRAVLLDPEGRERGREEGATAVADARRPEAVAGAVAEVCRRALTAAGLEAPVAALWAGLAGAGREPARASMEEALGREGLAERVAVGTDVAAAFHHAFGAGAGILIISGTGSIAQGRGEDGREARAGGWGPLLGDEGSGYAIGSEALRRLARATDGRAPAAPALCDDLLEAVGVSDVEALVPWIAGASRAEVAALAPVVAGAADAGEAAAREILDDAAASLVAHLRAVRARLEPWSSPPAVALAGGLLRPGRGLRARLEAVLEGAGLRTAPVEPDPALGAALLARTLLG